MRNSGKKWWFNIVGVGKRHLQSSLLLGLWEWGSKNDTQSGPSSVGVGVRDDLYYCWTVGGHLGYVTVSLPPLSWDRTGWGWLWLASYSWLHWVTHSVPRPVSLSSSEVLQAALVTIKHTMNFAIPSVTVIRLTLYISFYLTFRSFFFSVLQLSLLHKQDRAIATHFISWLAQQEARLFTQHRDITWVQSL